MDSWLRVHAAPVGQVLLRGIRATDLVARVAATRFQVLLPETTAEAAGGFVERVVGECQEQLRTIGAPLKLTDERRGFVGRGAAPGRALAGAPLDRGRLALFAPGAG